MDKAKTSKRLKKIENEINKNPPKDSYGREPYSLASWVYDMTQEKFWDMDSAILCTEKTVNGSIAPQEWPIDHDKEPDKKGRPARFKPAEWIKQRSNDQWVSGATWWPGQPRIIKDKELSEHGVIDKPGARLFNTWAPRSPMKGSAKAKNLWVDHVKALWPDPIVHEYFFDYCAHLIQHPDIKPVGGIVLSGAQGTGKDTALKAVIAAAGGAANLSMEMLFWNFTDFYRSTMVIINEVNADERRAYVVYDKLKQLMAAPPDTLMVNRKYLTPFFVPNVLRIFLTTNDYLSMHIPAEDRRMLIMHTDKKRGWADDAYWVKINQWLANGGAGHVQAWLRARDIAAFSAGIATAEKPYTAFSGPPKTVAFDKIAETTEANWDSPVAQALLALDLPEVVFSQELIEVPLIDYQSDVRKMFAGPARYTINRMHELGYDLVPCPSLTDRWTFKVNDYQYRSSKVFINVTKVGQVPNHEAVAMVLRRGKAIAARRVAERNRGKPTLTLAPRTEDEK